LQIIFVLQLREREQAKLKCLKRISLLQWWDSNQKWKFIWNKQKPKSLDNIVPEMGTIPYYARPELTQNISNHICIKERKSRRKKNWSHLWTTFWSWRYFKPCRICLV
jgi:hypothetical protein